MNEAVPILATLPETIQAARRETLRVLVPELKVQLERKRHLGIVRIAAPHPTRLSNHGGKVIDGMLVDRCDRLVAQLRDDIPRTPDLFARQQQIQVALCAMTRIANELGAVAEPLQDRMVESFGLER